MKCGVWVNITVGLDPSTRNNLDAIRSIPISTPTGEIIPLSSVAKVEYGMGANVVNREDVSRWEHPIFVIRQFNTMYILRE